VVFRRAWFSGERGFQASVVFRRASLSCGFVIVSRSRKRRLVVPAMAFGGDGIGNCRGNCRRLGFTWIRVHCVSLWCAVCVARNPCWLAWEDKTIGAFELPGWAIWLRCLELWVDELLSEASSARISENCFTNFVTLHRVRNACPRILHRRLTALTPTRATLRSEHAFQIMLLTVASVPERS